MHPWSCLFALVLLAASGPGRADPAAGAAVVPLAAGTALDRHPGLHAVSLTPPATGEAKAAAGPALDRATMARLPWRRGQVELPDAAPLELAFDAPLSSLVLELDGVDHGTLLQLALYRGRHAVATRQFGRQPPAGSSVVALTDDGAIGLASSTPFDRVRISRLRTAAGAALPTLVLAGVRAAAAGAKSDNSLAIACQAALGVTHNLAFGAALVPGSGLDAVANGVAYASNLALKFCPSVIEPPADRSVRIPTGSCSAGFAQPHMVDSYQNALGIPLAVNYDWGALGTPFVYHHNTEVDVLLLEGTPTPPFSLDLDLEFLLASGSFESTDRIWNGCRDDGSVRYSQPDGDGKVYECPYAKARTLWLPVGHNTLRWRAHPRIGPIDLLGIYIPGVPAGAKMQPYKGILLNLVREAFIMALDAPLSGWRMPNAHDAYQTVTVVDDTPPTITPQPYSDSRIQAVIVDGILRVRIEADEAGGVSAMRYEPVLRALLEVADACDRPTTLAAAYPEERLRSFWPVSGQGGNLPFLITWTARDPGPNLAGVPNTTTTTMRVEVVDTRPPAIVAPADIVEVDSASVSDLGQPLVFDFVDLDPDVDHDATLPLGTGLHQVTWTASDASGNTAVATQIVNLKASNLAPQALPKQGPARVDAVSFEPTPIRLQGTDADGDPLRFHIEQAPENGFFVAPLYPYFVEDYRIERALDDNELLALCNNGQGVDRNFDLDFPSDPEYLTTTDDGRSFVVDRGWIDCHAGAPVTVERLGRIAVFDVDGTLLDSRQASVATMRDLVVDPRRDRIYSTQTSGDGGTSVLVFDTALELRALYRLNNVRERDSGACLTVYPGDACDVRLGVSAVLDDNDLLYVMRDNGWLHVLDGTLPPDYVPGSIHTPSWIGSLVDDGLSGAGDSLALDADGRLYASRRGRIYRWNASQDDAAGLAQPGAFDGWLGRCDADLAPGDQAVCDIANHRSLGYACTDAVCGVDAALNPAEQALCDDGTVQDARVGCRTGQFRGPRGIDIDPNDVLYVADSGNRRIQRFTADGFFAGQARSVCDGGCFVLGDFGNPADVSVNSTRFHVLDPATNLLHISLTSPFVEIGANFAELVYQSDNQFACADSADCIDRFAFSVSDGVRDAATGRTLRSTLAEVEVEVSRNVRAPFATTGPEQAVVEDVPLSITLDGSDPDPLDTLAFSLVSPPAHGSVAITGNQALYTPAADYWGEDVFSFSVSDGAAVSAPATVSVVVLEVNDPAAVMLPDGPEVAGVGYRYRMELEFVDVDPDERHHLVVDWGDGTVESEGEVDGNSVTGPLLLQSGNGAGRISASHVYTSAGARQPAVCLTDRVIDDGAGGEIPQAGLSLTTCESYPLQVIAGLDLTLGAEASSPTVLPGQSVSYLIVVRNLAPQSGAGTTATGVSLELALSGPLDSISLGADCTVAAGLTLQCALGSITPGDTAEVSFGLGVAADAVPGSLLRIDARATLDQDDVTPDNRLLQTTPIMQPADFHVGIGAGGLEDAPDAALGDGVCASAAGDCTLRAALAEADASGQPRVIALGHGVHALSEGPLEVGSEVVVLGNGAANTIVDASAIGESFNVRAGGVLRLEDLTVTGGLLNAWPGDLVARRVRFTNSAVSASYGGAILATGLVDIRDSTIDGNRGELEGSALFADGTAHGILENVTITGNSRGALAFDGGEFTLRHLTITGNSNGCCFNALDVGVLNVYGQAKVTVSNSVLAGNIAVDGVPNCRIAQDGQLLSAGNNAFGDLEGCDIALAASDLQVVDLGLSPPQDSSDGLPVRVPQPGSPLLDAFTGAACSGSDARGTARPQDGDGDGIGRCDIGAVEAVPTLVFRSGFEG